MEDCASEMMLEALKDIGIFARSHGFKGEYKLVNEKYKKILDEITVPAPAWETTLH